MGLSFGKCGTCRGKTFESGSGNARDVTGTGGEGSQIQGDGPDAERNGRDLCFLREMAGRDKERQSTPGRLRTLDMRGVSFARGGGGYVRHGEWWEVQGEHTLPPYLFSECGLTHIDLPERLDTIAEGALGDTRISRIVLPENVFVGASAFYGSSELAEVVFPPAGEGHLEGCF